MCPLLLGFFGLVSLVVPDAFALAVGFASSSRSFASAPLSRRETCACERPTSRAICRSVMSAWKRRSTIRRSRSLRERMLAASRSRSSVDAGALASADRGSCCASEEIATELRAFSAVRAPSISLCCRPSAVASSGTVGGRPSSDSSSPPRRRRSFRTRSSPRGIRTGLVRSRRWCRISPSITGDAKAAKPTPRLASNRSLALRSPTAPTCTRSSSSSPLPTCRRAIDLTSGRWEAIRRSRDTASETGPDRATTSIPS